MKLASLQTLILETTLHSRPVTEDVARLIKTRRDIDPQIRLGAYRNNVKGAHLKALDAAYPVCREVLGGRYWQQLLTREIQTFGSKSADLHEYGDFLPELLTRVQRELKELKELDYLGELAALEWCIHRTRFVARDPVFDWNAFQALTPENQARVTLKLSPALQILSLNQPVDALWHTHQKDKKVLPAQTSIVCAIHRDSDDAVTVNRLSNSEVSLLDTLREQPPLDSLPEAQSDALAKTLHRWIREGWIVGFDAGNTP